MKYLDNFENFRERIRKILVDVSNGKNISIAEQEIIDIIEDKEPEDKKEPILIGYLKKEFGYNNYKPILKGSNVYYDSIKDRYFFDMEPLNGTKTIRQYFYKKNLEPVIDFI